MVQTFQAATHEVLYCNEKINLMFLFTVCTYFLLFYVSVYMYKFIFI
jgi:hypothetical protein